MVAYTSKFEPEAATGAGWRNTGYNYDDAWARRPSESRESDDWHSAYDYDLFSTAVRFQGENSTLIPLHLGTTYQDNRSGMLKYMYDAEGIGSFVHCDDNGNVIALTNGDGNGELSATYDYDPFGNFIRGTGTAAALNPYRFSAKYHDDVLDLYYYGFRFYSPGQGRFLNRDPIGEVGGANLYAFVGNDPVNAWDYLGLIDFRFKGCADVQQESMIAIGERVKDAISEANRVVSDDFRSNNETKRILETWFGVNTTQGLGKQPLGLGKVRSTLAALDSAASNERVTIVCCGDCKEGEFGYVNRWFGLWAGRIHICLDTFDESDERLANTLVHEMAHKYAGIRGDRGYWERSIGDSAGPTGGVYTDPDHGSDIDLAPMDLRRNADTFSRMIINEFFRN